MKVLFKEGVARVANDLGLTPEFLTFLGRTGALGSFLSAYKKAASRAMHPDLQGSNDDDAAFESRLKQFNVALDTLATSEPDVREWCSLSTASRERVLLSELRRRNREVQQLRRELTNERKGRTKRWDISAR